MCRRSLHKNFLKINLFTFRSRENAAPGTVREVVKETEEILPNTTTVDLDQSDTAPLKKEEPNTELNISEKRAANSLDTNGEEERSVATRTFMSELKAESVIDDPLGSALMEAEKDTSATLKSVEKVVNADEKEEVKTAPALKTAATVAAKPRKTVAEKIAATKPSTSKYDTHNNESTDAELKEAMKDFLKTAVTDAVDAVVDARSVLIGAAAAAKSGLKEVRNLELFWSSLRRFYCGVGN